MRQAYALLPHVKITDLLLEVDRWTGFGRHFTHLKTGQPCEDRTLLLTAILADGINLGIAKMAEACPGTTARKLDWLASLHIRDETYALAIAELVNIITGTHSPSTGVKGRHLRPMGSVFAPVAVVKRLAKLIFVMARNLECFSTRTSPTSTPHSTAR